MPSIRGKENHFPQEPLCPCCKKKTIFEPNSFAHIGGGALLFDREEDYGRVDDDMEGYLYIAWHGAHCEEGGRGEDSDTEASVQIAEAVIGGQYSLFFCSTECLRAFLNQCVDKLEQKIRRKRNP